MLRLKILRVENRKTQTELGQLLGIGRVEYAEIEEGKKSLTEEMVKMLSKFYNVSRDYITGKTDARREEAAATYDFRDRLIEMVKALSNENSVMYGGEELEKKEYKVLHRCLKQTILMIDELRSDDEK